MADQPAWRPLPDDPDRDVVARMFDASSPDWVLGAPGDYQAAAAEAWKRDGSGWQQVVVVEWPGRRNHTDEHVRVRLMISPEDALGLADVMRHAASYLLGRGSGGAGKTGRGRG